MFGLFIPTVYVFVVAIVVPICIASSRNKKRRENNNQNNIQNTNNTYSHPGYVPGNTQRNGQGNVSVNARGVMQTNTSGSMQRNVPGNPQRSMQGKGQSGIQGKAAGNTQRNTDGNTSGKKSQAQSGSTTKYLEKKAMEDQREHAVEKMEEKRRVDAKYGNIPTAKRHILGDPVPSGMKIVCCEYCGAENEVKMGYRGTLACYFCRTEL